MESSLFNRLQATVLALATAGLVVLAVLNYRQETQFQQPDDGVWWREVHGGLEAVKVLPNSPGQRAGIQQHDLLTGAAVLPDTAAQRAGMQTQDLLSGEKAQPANPAKQTATSRVSAGKTATPGTAEQGGPPAEAFRRPADSGSAFRRVEREYPAAPLRR